MGAADKGVSLRRLSLAMAPARCATEAARSVTAGQSNATKPTVSACLIEHAELSSK